MGLRYNKFNRFGLGLVLICFVLPAVLSLVFLGRLTGIREGTVLTALLVGRMMGVIRKFVGPWIQRVCFGEE